MDLPGIVAVTFRILLCLWKVCLGDHEALGLWLTTCWWCLCYFSAVSCFVIHIAADSQHPLLSVVFLLKQYWNFNWPIMGSMAIVGFTYEIFSFLFYCPLECLKRTSSKQTVTWFVRSNSSESGDAKGMVAYATLILSQCWWFGVICN